MSAHVKSAVILAVDVGGTKAHGALFDRSYTVLVDRSAPTIGRDPGLGATMALVRQLLADASAQGLQVCALAGGFPEYVSREGALRAREVLDWTEQPLESLKRLADGAAVVVDSDVRCGARGELGFGEGRTANDFVYVSLGTGLSSAIVWNGSIHTGARGEAIALGELPVSREVDVSWTGNLESYASGTGIAERFAAERGSEVLPGGARTVVERAERGDRLAERTLSTAGAAIGAALAQITSLIDPPLFVLGGGLGAADTPVRHGIADQFQRLTRHRANPPSIRTSSVPANSGLLGAALSAWTAAADHSR